jgi:hypothetical protein
MVSVVNQEIPKEGKKIAGEELETSKGYQCFKVDTKNTVKKSMK